MASGGRQEAGAGTWGHGHGQTDGQSHGQTRYSTHRLLPRCRGRTPLKYRRGSHSRGAPGSLRCRPAPGGASSAHPKAAARPRALTGDLKPPPPLLRGPPRDLQSKWRLSRAGGEGERGGKGRGQRGPAPTGGPEARRAPSPAGAPPPGRPLPANATGAAGGAGSCRRPPARGMLGRVVLGASRADRAWVENKCICV